MSVDQKKRVASLWDLPCTSAYLNLHEAKPRSLFTAAICDDSGKYSKDVALIQFDSTTGVVTTAPEFMPSAAQQAAITSEFEMSEWPTPFLTLKHAPPLPPELKDVPQDHIYELWDEEGHFVMLHVRRETDSGKYFQAWTYFSDRKWRMMEPGGKLPLYGIFRMDKGKRVNQLHESYCAFIHEGPKGALKMQRMLDSGKLRDDPKFEDHPWGDLLRLGAHVAYIGGVNAVQRTDFSSLRKAGIEKAIIVADNDAPGEAAVAKIAHELHCHTQVVLFNDMFPVGFDLGDDFPEEMFSEIDGRKIYTGPSIESLLHDATFATTRRVVGSKKSDVIVTIRPHFLECYRYIPDLDLYVDAYNPTRRYTEKQFNNLRAPYSHVSNLARLFNQARSSVTYKLCYNPADPRFEISEGGTASVNVYMPSRIRPIKGDIGPFKQYMEYMFPNKDERHTMYRWCYTLIARPDIRMQWAILLISTTQGIGKTTLGSQILAPLVGEHNASTPGESDVVHPQFNGWAANKRLAVVNEIYSGQSWKAYNKLKSTITDQDITVNIKYIPAHTIANWVHIFASSNSERALKMEQTDRRWFVPYLTETKWSKERFDQFHGWLRSGGLSVIMDAARNWPEGEYVQPGEAAPESARKAEMAYDSLSPAVRDVLDLVAVMNAETDPIVTTVRAIEDWVRRDPQVRVFESGLELRKAATGAGLAHYGGRHTIKGKSEYLLLNKAAHTQVEEMKAQGAEDCEIVAWLRTVNKPAMEIMPVTL